MGIGSKIKKKLKKIIPKEVGVVGKVIAPFNPILGAGLSALGGYRSGGFKGALTGGLGAYALGQGARFLGGAGFQGAPKFLGGSGTGGLGLSSPLGTDTGIGKLLESFKQPATSPDSSLTKSRFFDGKAPDAVSGVTKATKTAAEKKGLLARAKAIFDGMTVSQKIALGVGSAAALAALLEGGGEGGISNLQVGNQLGYMDPNIRGTSDMFVNVNPKFKNTMYDSNKVFTTVPNAKDGGRIGFKDGMFVGLQGNVKISPGIREAINSTYYGKSRDFMLKEIFPKLNLDPTAGRFIAGSADGGIIGLANGGEPAMEMDYRGGGFIPVGSKERADDVPARLSKNEFVMTADAVRAAGGGSVDVGAQRMYDLMNNLEAQA
tara:strand:- start:13099 stop:14229 length:1131 start_codon:yes stop_codon:yes gene_type:complete